MHNVSFLKVRGYDGLVRDSSTGAIINTNKAEYNHYLKQKKLVEERKSQIEQISKHSEDINNLKNELSEIKGLILQLLNK